MPRALWKGAITFGLVHIPVALYPAARTQALDFDWLDKRDMQPVGYRRINKHTGKEIDRENIVRGLKYEDELYVVLSDEEIKAANPKSTQAVDIVAFIDAAEIPPYFFDAPYVLAPVGRGEKVYALLREALRSSGKAGLAFVILQTKQHLAALLPYGDALIVNTLRWNDEIRSFDELNLPATTSKDKAPFSKKELEMAEQLIDDMTKPWDPSEYEDTFRSDIMALVERKAQSGETQEVHMPDVKPMATADIVDLTALLKRSLRGSESSDKEKSAPRKSATVTPVKKAAKSTATKTAAKKASASRKTSRSAAKRAPAPAKTRARRSA